LLKSTRSVFGGAVGATGVAALGAGLFGSLNCLPVANSLAKGFVTAGEKKPCKLAVKFLSISDEGEAAGVYPTSSRFCGGTVKIGREWGFALGSDSGLAAGAGARAMAVLPAAVVDAVVDASCPSQVTSKTMAVLLAAVVDAVVDASCPSQVTSQLRMPSSLGLLIATICPRASRLPNAAI